MCYEVTTHYHVRGAWVMVIEVWRWGRGNWAVAGRRYEFPVLLRRAFLISSRNPKVTYATMGQTLVMALLVGTLYYNVKDGACAELIAWCAALPPPPSLKYPISD